MRGFWLAVLFVLIGFPALAQSTAQPSVMGYLTTSGCPAGVTSCFVQYGSTVPTSGGGSGSTPATPVSSPSISSNLVVKASSGALVSFSATADSALAPSGSSVWYLMFFNATSAPADGAVTPVKCYQVTGAQTGGTFAASGVTFSTGIVEVASTTGCFSKTASAHAFLAGDFQ